MTIPAFFEFECPVKTHCGSRALEHVPFELRAMAVTKPLVIGDRTATSDQRLPPVINACRDADMTLGIVEDITLEDTEDCVRQLAAIYRDKDCDAIVAVGQGHFIDMGKWLNIIVSTGQETLAPFEEGESLPRSLNPLAVIPSAAADGMELSGHLNIGDHTIRSVSLMPHLLFLDARSVGQPEDVAMIETAMIALTIGVEISFSEDSNPMTAIYARTAAQLASTALHQLAGRGERDERLALNVAHAAALSGCALGSRPRLPTQSIGLALAESGKISAAQAMGIVLSYILDYRTATDGLCTDDLLGLLGGSDRFARTPASQRGQSGLFLQRNLLNQLFEKNGRPDSSNAAGCRLG